jgi:phosphate transport system substrate-binding protein
MTQSERAQKMHSAGKVRMLIPWLCWCLIWAGWPLERAVQAEDSPAAFHLILAGSGTNLPLVRVLAAEFSQDQPQIRIEVPPSIGSSGAIRAAADGAVALGLISRQLKPAEEELGLTVVPYARTPVLIAVNPSVPEAGISYAELLDIYRGTKNQWQNGREIIVLTREPEDSSIEVLIQKVPGFKAVYERSRRDNRWATLYQDLVMNQTLAGTADAIGLSDLGTLTIEKHNIRPLRVNGAAPTLGQLSQGAYPLFKTLSFVYRTELLTRETRLFIDFVRSSQGRQIMRDNGYLPKN